MERRIFTTRSLANLLLCLVVAGLLSACASKAKVIQAGATQFENEALAAIERIDELRKKETAVSPLPPEEAVDQFVKLVEGFPGPINREELRFLENPGALDTRKSEAAWQSFLAQLRTQYRTFASIFDSLEEGSLFARSSVGETVDLVDPLIGQMAAFAKSIGENPAEFTSERAVIAIELEETRDDTTLTAAQRRKDLSRLRQRLVDLAAEEERVTREAIAQCLQTARLGTELRKLLEDFDQITVDDISDGLNSAFEVASVLPGLDLSTLKGETDTVIGQINADPKLKGFLDTALAEIELARPNPAPGS